MPAVDILAFTVAAVITSLWSLQMPGWGAVSIADAVYLAALSVLGPSATVAVAAVAASARALRDARALPAMVVCWTACQTLLAVALAAVASALLSLPAAMVVLALAQGILSATLRAAREGVPFYPAMVRRRQIALSLLVAAPLGLLFATLWRIAPLGLAFLLLPIAMMYRSLEHYTEVLGEARDAIEDMALAVERRDPCMSGHAARVARLAGEMARQMRLPEEEVEAIVTAARLHDLGKISVPDRILLKAERLGEDELGEVKAHTIVGGKVVAHCSLLQRQGDVASLIRQHHERFDGRGYPDGLKGEEILLGARILAVAEAWDTMTTPRTWRVVLTGQQALAALLAGRGTQFDPRVVDAFLAVVNRKEAQRAA
jgi:HD-GYP domain-containing protein (c-di-GMP phosphodiesterase class II)